MPPGGAQPQPQAPAAAAAAAGQQGHGPATTLRPLPTLVYDDDLEAGAAAEAEEPSYPRSKYDEVTFWQLLTFSFVTPVVKQGLRKPLQQEDVEEVGDGRGRFMHVHPSPPRGLTGCK